MNIEVVPPEPSALIYVSDTRQKPVTVIINRCNLTDFNLFAFFTFKQAKVCTIIPLLVTVAVSIVVQTPFLQSNCMALLNRKPRLKQIKACQTTWVIENYSSSALLTEDSALEMTSSLKMLFTSYIAKPNIYIIRFARKKSAMRACSFLTKYP